MRFSTRVKGWLRRAWKPAAMTLVAGGLAMSLVVTTPSNAQAAILLPPPVLLGSGVMPLADAVGVVSLTGPIGWGLLGLGVVAVGLIATQDYWLPYVKGAFGQVDPNGNSPGQAGAHPRAGVHTDPLTINSGANSFSTKVVNVAGSPNYNANVYVTVIKECKTTTGVVNRTSSQIGATFTSSVSYMNASGSCATGTSLVGAAVVGECMLAACPDGYSGKTAPENIATWGTMAPPSFDPNSAQTKYSTTVECVRADGTKFSISKDSTGADGALAVPACAAVDPGSHATGKMDVVGTPPPGTVAAAPQTLLSRPAVAPLADKPLCDISKPGQPCKLAVYVDGKECLVGQWECANWASLKNDPNQSPRLSCQQGPYVIALTGCNVLERAYEVGGAPATEKNTDGDPSTRSDVDPNGQQIPKPSTGGSTGTGTSTGTLPTVGTNPGTSDGPEGDNCWGKGWSWNPVSWVMVPVSCSLQWAFVPPQAKLQETADAIEPKLEARGITPFLTPIISGVGGLGGSGCSGPPIDLTVIHLPTFYPFSACDAPMSTIAGGVNIFFSLWLVLTGGMSCVRGIGAAFGFNMSMGSQLDDVEAKQF